MRKLLKIGQKEFKFKKDALAYYKAVLNSYSFGESLNNFDYEAVIDLLAYDYLNCLAEDEALEQDDEDVQEINKNSTDDSEDGISIIDIQVAQVQFKQPNRMSV